MRATRRACDVRWIPTRSDVLELVLSFPSIDDGVVSLALVALMPRDEEHEDCKEEKRESHVLCASCDAAESYRDARAVASYFSSDFTHAKRMRTEHS
jgi:hypothetical protein